MAPLLTEEESLLDPYTILSVPSSASDKEIRKSYRQLSLKYHPDRNSAPEAVAKFRELSLSLEILIDGVKRAFVDGKLEGERRRKEKYAELDKKRKAMVDALNAREEEAKKAKVDAVVRRKAAAEEEAIKDAGRRMLEEAQKRAAAASASTAAATATASGFQPGPFKSSNGQANAKHATQPSEAGPSRSPNGHSANGSRPPITSSTDLTLILSFPSSSPLSATGSDIKGEVESRYGPVAHLIIKEPTMATEGTSGKKTANGKGKGKAKRAIVEFESSNWAGCWACWRDHGAGSVGDKQEDGSRIPGESAKRSTGSTRSTLGLGPGVKAKWMAGSTPEWITWADGRSSSNSNSTHWPNGKGANGDTNHTIGTGSRSGDHHEPPTSAQSAPSFSFNSETTATPSFSFNVDSLNGSAAASAAASISAAQAAERERVAEERRKADEFESMTLFRMRQVEREKLAEAIRRQEEEED